MLLQSILEASAARAPEREALIAGGRRASFAELERESNRIAHALLAAGLARGDRVVIALDHSVETVTALFGALKAGGVFLMASPQTRPERLAYLLDDSRAVALFVSGDRLPALASLLAGRPHLGTVVAAGGRSEPPVNRKTVIDLDAALAAGRDTPPETRSIDLDLAGLLYTSGSTGEPKGVMLTHGNILAATRSIAAYLRLGADDVLFDVLPLSFGYGLTQLFTSLYAGARLVVEGGMVFPHLTLSRMAEERATGFAMVPTTAAILLGLDLARYDLSSLRYLTNAGAGLAPEQVRRLRAALPRAQLFCMYGQTECLRALYLEPDELERRPGSVGRGMPNQELFLVDEQGREPGPNGCGELVVRGAHVMRGYWDRPEATARKLRPLPPAIRQTSGVPDEERLLYTGDLFRRDSDGYLFFVGRTDDVFKSRGQKVSPYEVESALYALPGVVEAAVIGVPDPVLGCAVKAILALAPGVTLTVEEVRRHCALRLEDHLVPGQVEFRAELPKNERGKIARRAL